MPMSFAEVLFFMGIVVIIFAIILHVIFLNQIHRNGKADTRALSVLWLSVVGAPVVCFLITQITTVLAVGIAAGFLWLSAGIYRALCLLMSAKKRFVIRYAIIAVLLSTLLSVVLVIVFGLLFFSNFSFEL